MAKQENNVIEIYPIPPSLKIPKAAWDATPVELKSEAIRMWIELSAGIAIAKDKRCGRPKPHRSHPQPVTSFYALHLLDVDIWRYPTNTVKIAEAEKMRAALAPDVERMQQSDDLEEFHQIAAASGTTLKEALSKYVAVEQRLRADPVAEIARIIMNMGKDPVAFARRYLDEHPVEPDAA